MSDVADLLVTLGFLVQSALLLWSGYSLHKCSRTIRRQADLIDVQQDLLRRQYHLLANISPESGWKLTEVSSAHAPLHAWKPALHEMPHWVPSHVGAPFAGSGHGVHEAPQLAVDLSSAHSPLHG